MDCLNELYDVIDVNGNETGILRSRDYIHKNGLFHKVVHTWICNKNGNILMQLRAKGILYYLKYLEKDNFPNKWDISSAGHIDAGESVDDAIIRECFVFFKL